MSPNPEEKIKTYPENKMCTQICKQNQIFVIECKSNNIFNVFSKRNAWALRQKKNHFSLNLSES